MDINKIFEKNGLELTKQAEKMVNRLDKKEEHINVILNQAKKRKLIIGGGDIIKYMITGEISQNIVNSEDIK